ncbi:hypothetical protein X777_08949 [Ooceraea biroi]|uniref:Uncharacterized protein n=1 Tax=Ooceraea biroi TaxID=2015173 RepID=A0A026WB71_OOCBI|nr:hypothetical protein X777_08949 [Ooceraea biroi]
MLPLVTSANLPREIQGRDDAYEDESGEGATRSRIHARGCAASTFRGTEIYGLIRRGDPAVVR